MAEKKTATVGKEPNDKPKSREKILEARLKALGIDRACLKMGKDAFTVEVFLPTGISEVDEILGDGHGIPEGTLVEFCGESQSGKTHVALKLIAEAHKKEKRCAFLNVENSFYPPRAAALGVDVYNGDLFEMYDGIEYAETYGKLLFDLVGSGDYAVVVVDSISAMIPEVDYNKDLGDNPKIGAHAAFVNRICKKLLGLCNSTGTIVVLINQFRMGAGAMPNSMVKTATGGAGISYFTHMRLWLDRIRGAGGVVLGANGDKIGGKARLRVVKTRFGIPDVECIFPVYNNKEEVNPLGEFLYIAQAKGKEHIKVYYKEYQYYDKNTGEQLAATKDPIAFVEMLMDIPAPEKRTKGDNSTTAFEFITGRMKYSEAQIKTIVDALKEPASSAIEAPKDLVQVKLLDENSEENTD